MLCEINIDLVSFTRLLIMHCKLKVNEHKNFIGLGNNCNVVIFISQHL